MKKITKTLAAVLACAGMASCAEHSMEIVLTNTLDFDRNGEMVEIVPDFAAANYYVLNSEGVEVPSQFTHDSLLIFRADVAANSKAVYKVFASDTAHVYPQIACGRIYPERADDVAWENELIGFRVYGPATQAKGERAFGYDVFLKHTSDEPMLEKLYKVECDPVTWQKADSLRKIDNNLAEEFIKTFSYHIDHGLGMDCYAVGPTLGAGAPGVLSADTIDYSWCYETAEVLDNGPLRFTVRLTFPKREIAGNEDVVETRLISLDAGSYLNKSQVSYSAPDAGLNTVVGFPLRDSSATYAENGVVAYADPTQGPDNGKALLGIVAADGAFAEYRNIDNHILGISSSESQAPFAYRWGCAWDREQIKNLNDWTAHLNRVRLTDANPLTSK